jgi:Trypsin-like peptidase domain
MESRALVISVLFASASFAQAQQKEMLERLERLQPAQQRQFKALIEMREKQPMAKFFSSHDVLMSEHVGAVTSGSSPIASADLAAIASRAVAVFGRHDFSPFSLVDVKVPAYRYCPQCADQLAPMCGPKLAGDWRRGATQVLKTYSNLVPAVVSIHARFGTEPFQIIGTGFFVKDRLLTNKHVGVERNYIDRVAIGVYRIASAAQFEISIQGNGQRVALPAMTKMWAHLTEDVLAIEWPSGAPAAPVGLNLSSEPPKLHEEIVVLGYPKANTTADAEDRIANVFGLCPEAPRSVDLGLRLARGVVNEPIAREFSHSANTLGNNSGSPVVRTSDGKVIGIHKSDAASGQSNLAVESAAILDLLAKAPP